MPRRDCDRNLLFGILALQMDFIGRDALVAAMNAWVLEKGRPLGEILAGRGEFDPAAREVLERMVDLHVARHAGDPAASLAALGSAGGVASDLRRSIADADVLGSLATVPPDPYATRAAVPPLPSAPGIRFRKLRQHAAGNLGVVYVARDEELNREVALKEIKEKNADHLHSQAKFLLEAEVTGGLEHPGIVPVYGLGHHADGRPFYAMRFIRGRSLLEAIRRFHADDGLKAAPGRRLLELQKLIRRFTDVCNAVAYAHSRGVLHRDLKPDNVMVGQYGETLVVDWGLAKALGRYGDPATAYDPHDPFHEPSLQPSSSGGMEETQAGQLVGTPAYMSPEQAAGRLDLLGPASDIYGLGATLYHMIVGSPPIGGADLGEFLARIRRGEFPLPRSVAPWLDPALEAICLKAMACKPESRYGTPKALAEDLDRWTAGEPVAAYPEPFARRARRWADRHRMALATVTSTAIVAALILGGFAWARIVERRRTDTSALRVLDQAARLAAEARSSGDLLRWSRAVAEARQAEARLESGAGSASLRREAKAMLQALRAEEGRCREDLRMTAALFEAGLQAAKTKDDGFWGHDGKEGAYLSAFRDYGLDIMAHRVEDAVGQVRSSRIADDLISALDDWAGSEPRIVPRSRLEAIARAAEADPVRIDVRNAVTRRDAVGLRRLCGREEDRRKLGPRLRSVFAALLRLDPEGSMPLLEVIRSENPSDFRINHDLAWAYLHAKSPQCEEAVRGLSVAVALRPDSPNVHLNLGVALERHAKADQAIAEYRIAIRINPDHRRAHWMLGNALRGQGKLDEALTEFRESLRLDPDDPISHYSVGIVLQDKGLFREALESLEKSGRVGRDVVKHNLKLLIEPAVRSARRLVEEDAKLASILEGEASPENVEERLALALVSYKKGWPATSVRFYVEAFAERPSLIDDLKHGYRYNAACFASLASAGRSKEPHPPDEAARGTFRMEALAWLRADLAEWARVLDGGGDQDLKQAVGQTLVHWKEDADLDGMRDEAALARLPEAEREAFRSLWADVEALRKKAEGIGTKSVRDR